MASTASLETGPRRGWGPISLHPAFPKIVALWFAALLGLGSLALPAVLLDGLAEGIGLGALVPAVGPPLGFGARAGIALFAALGGAALGLAIARRVTASSRASGPGRTLNSRRAHGPLRVHEELGEDGVTNGHAAPLSRRRATLIAEGLQAGDVPEDLPERVRAAIASPADPAGPAFPAAPTDDEPLLLRELACVNQPTPAAQQTGHPTDTAFKEPPMTDQEPLPAAPVFEERFPSAPSGSNEPDSGHSTFGQNSGERDPNSRNSADRTHGPARAFGGAAPQVFAAPPAPDSPAPFEEKPEDDWGDATQVWQPRTVPEADTGRERGHEAAPDPEPELEPEAEPEAFGEPEPEQETEAGGMPVLEPIASDASERAAPAEWEDGPVADLGLVQLVQRLGSAIDKRRVAMAALSTPATDAEVQLDHSPQDQPEPAPTPALPLVPDTGIEAARADEAARAMAAYFGSHPGSDETVRLRESSAAEPSPMTAPAASVADAAASPEPAPQPFREPALRPAFLTGLAAAAAGAEDDESEDPFPDFSLPLRRAAASPLESFMPSAEPETKSEETSEDGENEGLDHDGFRSLLSLRTPGANARKSGYIALGQPENGAAASPASADEDRPFDSPIPGPPLPGPQGVAPRQAFLEPGRLPEADPRAASEPDAAPDTDAALRAALATLQRMSGAA